MDHVTDIFETDVDSVEDAEEAYQQQCEQHHQVYAQEVKCKPDRRRHFHARHCAPPQSFARVAGPLMMSL